MLTPNALKQIDLSEFAAINQIHAAPTVSQKYAFIATAQALSVLADFGWFPTQAVQARTRKEEHQGYQRHAVRLTNVNTNRALQVGDVVPQILLRNSHSGTQSFILTIALNVLVCSNGLVAAGGVQDELRVRHIGYTDSLMENAVKQLAEGIPSVLAETDRFKGIRLNNDEREAFAKAAIDLRFDGEKYAIQPSEMLHTSRREEKDPTLWNTANILQEKVIRGGVNQRRVANGSRIRSRAVKNIEQDVRLNKAIWTLTTEMAKIKEGR